MICCLAADPSSARVVGALEAVARSCSPRVAPHGDEAVLFDARGLARLFGAPQDLAAEVRRLATERGMAVRVALASTSTAAWILAHARSGVTIVPPGRDANVLAPLPMGWLAVLPEMALTPEAPIRRRARARHYRMAPGPQESSKFGLRQAQAIPSSSRDEVQSSKLTIATIERWGIRTLGDLASLPRADVLARLGPMGVRLHQAASGQDAVPLVPVNEAATWSERFECEWPVEGLEPLSFVLARVCETLSLRLEQADRGAIEVTTRLRLVTREMHERVLHLPAPMRDARGLRTLMLLDLESHPPPAGVDVVEVELGVAPGRIVHGSLLARPIPEPDQLATLTARLGALMGESRIGAPVIVDTHDERATAMKRFNPSQKPDANNQKSEAQSQKPETSSCLRRFRLPIAARVTVDHHTPVRVTPSARGITGGEVVACAGPWRTSGYWWALDQAGWDRDEWDVELADGGVYRLARDRSSGTWVIEGTVD